MEYKNKITGRIITQNEYLRLDSRKQQNYGQYYGSSSWVSLEIEPLSSIDFSSNDSSSFDGFGGGDFGGGGVSDE